MAEVNELSFEDIGHAIIEAEGSLRAAERLSMQSNAFTAWRVENTITQLLAGKTIEGNETFPAYLEKHGMLTPQEKKAAKEERERIREMRQNHTKAQAEKMRKLWKAQTGIK